MESHRTHSFPASNCDNMLEMLSTREAWLETPARGFTGGWSGRHLLEHTKIPDYQKKRKYSAQITLLIPTVWVQRATLIS